jgi:hypothetical protein
MAYMSGERDNAVLDAMLAPFIRRLANETDPVVREAFTLGQEQEDEAIEHVFQQYLDAIAVGDEERRKILERWFKEHGIGPTLSSPN